MRFFHTWLAVLAIGAILAVGCAKKQEPETTAKPQEGAEAKQSKPQTTCPVMGSKIDRKLYVDVQGKRIYVCCQACVEAVKKDPDKYLAKAQEGGVELEDAPKSE